MREVRRDVRGRELAGVAQGVAPQARRIERARRGGTSSRRRGDGRARRPNARPPVRGPARERRRRRADPRPARPPPRGGRAHAPAGHRARVVLLLPRRPRPWGDSTRRREPRSRRGCARRRRSARRDGIAEWTSPTPSPTRAPPQQQKQPGTRRSAGGVDEEKAKGPRRPGWKPTRRRGDRRAEVRVGGSRTSPPRVRPGGPRRTSPRRSDTETTTTTTTKRQNPRQSQRRRTHPLIEAIDALVGGSSTAPSAVTADDALPSRVRPHRAAKGAGADQAGGSRRETGSRASRREGPGQTKVGKPENGEARPGTIAKPPFDRPNRRYPGGRAGR